MTGKDPIKRREYKKKYYLKNRDKVNEYKRKYYLKNKKYWKEYYLKNTDKLLKKHKEYNLKNKEKAREYRKKYYLNNKEKLLKYTRERYKTDLNFKLKHNYRVRIRLALKGKLKSASSVKLMGVDDIKTVWDHLEKLFKPGMTKENYGKWHVDHIIPCAAFDLTKPGEQFKCFHYTNLQPLWAHENFSKSDKNTTVVV